MLIEIYFKSYQPLIYQKYLIKNTVFLILLWFKIFLRIHLKNLHQKRLYFYKFLRKF